MNQDQYILWTWNEFVNFHNHHCRKYLTDNYSYLVKYFAERTQDGLQKAIGPDKSIDIIEPLVQAGIEGLAEAIDSFDPIDEIEFEDFCKPFIKEAFGAYSRSHTIFARTVRNDTEEDAGNNPSCQKAPDYPRAVLWRYAFTRAYSQFFYCVDSESNEITPEYLDPETLSEENLATYLGFSHTAFEECEELFYQVVEEEAE